MPRLSTVLIVCLVCSAVILTFRTGMLKAEDDKRYERARDVCKEHVLLLTDAMYVCIRKEAVISFTLR